MTTMLVWVLVTVGGNNGHLVTYSPPFPTEAECLRVKKVLPAVPSRSTCVQMTIAK